MKRYGQTIRVRPEKLDLYRRLHANPWPEVLAAIHECNVRNFSIYVRDGYLFSYYEYIGDDYPADMRKLGQLTAHWLRETDPCQEKIPSARPEEWWSMMEEVFHCD